MDDMNGLLPTEEQRIAYGAMRSHVMSNDGATAMSFTGPAGSGKSTLLAALIRELLAMRVPVLIAGPTHASVSVLAGLIGTARGKIKCSTVASAMGWRMFEREDGGKSLVTSTPEAAPIFEFRVVLIDEASMIPDAQVDAVIEVASQNGIRLIFSGDLPQMRPVTGSERSKSLTLTRRAALKTIMRQPPKNDLTSSLQMIRTLSDRDARLKAADLLVLPTGDGTLVRKRGALKAGVDQVIEFATARETSMLICYRNEFVQAANMAAFNALYPGAVGPFGIGEGVLFNDEHEGRYGMVRNNARGIVTSMEPAVNRAFPDAPCFKVTLEMVEGYLRNATVLVHADPMRWEHAIAHAWSDYRHARARRQVVLQAALSLRAKRMQAAFAPLRHLYAATVYKAQGRTLDHAIVLVDDLLAMPKSQPSLYVATSRARKTATLISHEFK